MTQLGTFQIHVVTEADVDAVIAESGGRRAHPDSDRRLVPGADYVLGDAVIELKMLDDEGLAKPQRQAKLAKLFRQAEKDRPVIVLDRKRLSKEEQSAYDQIIEGPIKSIVAKSRAQLKQSRADILESRCSVLFVVNNGYTAIDHEALKRHVARRVRNDTREIDAVVVAGCYFYSDGFDSFFLWPIDLVPINLENGFRGYEDLRRAWNDHATAYMTALIKGGATGARQKGPVIDVQYELDGVTYVKPAPPIGVDSVFYRGRRPRFDSIDLTSCPPVATTFPAMTAPEWSKFRAALPDEWELRATYAEWLVHWSDARESGVELAPFVSIPVTCRGWKTWCTMHRHPRTVHSIREYANELFDDRVREIMTSARDRRACAILPSRYVLTVTEVIGQDQANDVSHLAVLCERPGAEAMVKALVQSARIRREHALALGAAYAIANGAGSLLWEEDLTYAWI